MPNWLTHELNWTAGKTTKVQNFHNPVKNEIHNPITGILRDSETHLPLMRAQSEMTRVGLVWGLL